MEILNIHLFTERSKDNHKLYDKMFNEFMETSHIIDENDRRVELHINFKDEKNQYHKLEEISLEEELSRLKELREELKERVR